MSTSQKPGDEQPSTYFVQDRNSKNERTRVLLQDQMVTEAMGGVLPEQSDPARFASVLDVACGTGGWLVEVAKTYPSITRLAGVDISGNMIEYARELVAAQQLGGRVEFQVMDVLHGLEFPDSSFELVNQRFGESYLRTWDWPKIMSEMQRVCRPGGVLRLTESNAIVESNSPSLTRLFKIGLEAGYRAGLFTAPESDIVVRELAPMLKRYGFHDVQTHAHTLFYRAGTPAGERHAQDMAKLYRNALPFFRKWTRVPDDYEQIYQQALREMQQPDFVATSRMLTAWGTNPLAKGSLTAPTVH